jgi:hypothetical protein
MKKKTPNGDLVVKQLWRNSPGDYVSVSSKSPTGKWKDKFFKKNRMSDAIEYARGLEGFNVYMGTHAYSKPRRHKDFSIDPHHFYADLDEMHPAKCEIKPTIAIQSSPGRYVGFWKFRAKKKTPKNGISRWN